MKGSREHLVTYIGFEEHAVAVRSGAVDLHRGVAERFGAMLSTVPRETCGCFTVASDAGQEYVLRDSDDLLTRGDLHEVLVELRHGVIRHLVDARPDLLWFHAGGVVHDGRAVFMPGRWGSGKSTLTISFCDAGWAYLSDDIVPLDLETGRVLPFPLTPAAREGPKRELSRSEVAELPKTTRKVRSDEICNDPTSVGEIIFPRFSSGAAVEVSPCPPARAVLGLLDSCINFHHHESEGIESLCALVEEYSALILAHDGQIRDSELVPEVLTHLAKPPDC